jgi:hypothetical protein
VAPVTAEYVPAKARDKEYGQDGRLGEHTKGEGEKVGGENTFTVKERGKGALFVLYYFAW